MSPANERQRYVGCARTQNDHSVWVQPMKHDVRLQRRLSLVEPDHRIIFDAENMRSLADDILQGIAALCVIVVDTFMKRCTLIAATVVE